MNIQLGQILSFCRLGSRHNQEDARYPDIDRPSQTQRFFVVCDGVGGSEMGEVASTTVCQAFAQVLRNTDFTVDFTNEAFSHALDAAFDALDRKSIQLDADDFATTLAFAAFHGGGCTLAHIGDSRIYQFRRNIGILYQSADHSLVNQLVHEGMITADEALDHPQNHVITRSMEPVFGYFLFIYINFILGVYNCFDEEELARLFSLSPHVEEAFAQLAAKCEQSSDNNTAFLISIAEVENTIIDEHSSAITTNISTSLTEILSESHRQ